MLKESLSKKRSAILKRWLDLILETYWPETAIFLKKQDDPFTNPVGQTILQGIDGIFNDILNGAGSENAAAFLEKVIKIRAVQDFTASQAISFVFLLKKAVREELKDEINRDRLHEDLSLLNDRVDELALIAFDMYMKSREKIYELKSNEIKNMTFRLLQRANLICEVQQE
jgi:hypothetical protein